MALNNYKSALNSMNLQNELAPKLKVLVIDDDVLTLELVSHMLRNEFDAEVFAFESCLEALSKFEKNSEVINIIISDWEVPGMDGLEFLKNVRKLNTNIPFLMMTAHASKNRVIAASKLGISGYLAKPFTQQNLIIKITEILNKEITDL